MPSNVLRPCRPCPLSGCPAACCTSRRRYAHGGWRYAHGGWRCHCQTIIRRLPLDQMWNDQLNPFIEKTEYHRERRSSQSPSLPTVATPKMTQIRSDFVVHNRPTTPGLLLCPARLWSLPACSCVAHACVPGCSFDLLVDFLVVVCLETQAQTRSSRTLCADVS